VIRRHAEKSKRFNKREGRDIALLSTKRIEHERIPMKPSSFSLGGKLLLFLLPSLLLLLAETPSPLVAAEGSPKVTIQPVHAAVEGAPILLRLRILPAPTHSHPLHLHLYVDGRMALMTTASTSPVTVTLAALAAGRHEVRVVEADALTHREKGAMPGMEGMDRDHGGMEGMDMGSMDMNGMKESAPPSRKGYLAHLTLDVREKTP
jgi:hypothetical protein